MALSTVASRTAVIPSLLPINAFHDDLHGVTCTLSINSIFLTFSQVMRTKSKATLKKLMSISDNIADLNHERFKNFLRADDVEGNLDDEAADNLRPAVSVPASLCPQEKTC